MAGDGLPLCAAGTPVPPVSRLAPLPAPPVDTVPSGCPFGAA
ncbi:hypothetical protein [Caballeronia grimmiae]